MIGQNFPQCTLGLTTETLSAWRDGGVRGEEEQRIRQHTATCPVCRKRLDGFVTVASTLGRQRELEPGDRVWRGVQDRLAAQTRGSGSFLRLSSQTWQGMVAVASVVLIVGLLAFVLTTMRGQRGGPGPMSTATSTATIATTPTLTSSATTLGPQLAWQPAHLPAGLDVSVASHIVVAPHNGDVVYLCLAPAERDGHALETNAHMYVTRDRGQTWARGGDIPVGAQPQSSGKPFVLTCSIYVDALRPDIAVVETMWLQTGASGDISLISSFASFDYGAHWRKLVYPSPFAVGPKMASYAGSIYAFGDAQIRGGAPGLWVTHDQMTTWQALALPAGLDVSAFWLNPSTGALLLAANQQGSENSLLFSSADGGARWTQLPAPSSSAITWVAQAPQGAAPWRICGATTALGSAQMNTLTCSGDGGQTWATRRALNLAQNSPKGFQFFAPTSVFACASDGAVFATVVGSGSHIYRLPASSAVWQDLGPGPSSAIPSPAYYPTPTGGVLWVNDSGLFTATDSSA